MQIPLSWYDRSTLNTLVRYSLKFMTKPFTISERKNKNGLGNLTNYVVTQADAPQTS